MASAYLFIERYLVSQEKVQVFSRDALRGEIETTLEIDVSSNDTFWPLVVSGKAQLEYDDGGMPVSTAGNPGMLSA